MTFITFVAVAMLLASILVLMKILQEGNIEFYKFMEGFTTASVVFLVFTLLAHVMP